MRSNLAYGRGEDGFTLIELLVVMVVIGILAAIAIPSLLSQRNGAKDASAKQTAGTAEHAAVIYSLNNGSYSGMTPASLKTIEPSINTTANGQTVLASAGSTLTGYSVAVVSPAGDTFNIAVSNGVLSRTCTIASGNGNTTTNTGGGCTNGVW
jgi:type IV pilus assembly protein PilA